VTHTARPVSLLLAIIASSFFMMSWPTMSRAASHRTRNFLVTAATPELAQESAETAERLRRELAISWLGRELPDWQDKCPIQVNASPQLLAGGVTEFYFDRGRPYRWTMSVQGTRERVLDSVLPHEVLHTIFATHFGGPLPRWADEGACTTVEDISERSKQEKLLYRFLTNNQGIAFNRMFAMRDYPADVLPLYSQGYSLTRFLIALRGRQVFVRFVGEGMRTNDWASAVRRNYEIADLNQLQIQWLAWVRDGGEESQVAAYVKPAKAVTPASSQAATPTPPQAIATSNTPTMVPVPPLELPDVSPTTGTDLASHRADETTLGPSWYERQRDVYRASDPLTRQRRTTETKSSRATIFYR
jgi:hypothetical protein